MSMDAAYLVPKIRPIRTNLSPLNPDEESQYWIVRADRTAKSLKSLIPDTSNTIHIRYTTHMG